MLPGATALSARYTSGSTSTDMAAVKRINKKTGDVSYIGANLSEKQQADIDSGGATVGYTPRKPTAVTTSPSVGSPTPPPPPPTPGATVSGQTQINDPEPDPPTETKDDYTPRYYKPETTITQPQDVETIQRRMRDDAQGEINSLRKFERSLLDEQTVINEKADRSTAARNVLSGLAGSSEADIAQAATSEKGAKAKEVIRASVEVQVQGVLSAIRKDAIAEARAQRGDRTLDIQAEEARRKLASDSLATLAASGVTFEGLRKTSPDEFEYFARQFGGTEALRGAFVLNTPQDQILDKRIEGGKYVIAKQNPLTGKVSVETVDLGLPPSYTKTVDAGDRIIAIPDAWDGDPAKLISLTKGLTPSQTKDHGSSDSVYESDLDAIIGTVLSTIPTKFGQATFQSQMKKARNDTDKISLIAAQVLKGQPAEFKNDFRNQAVGISELDKAIALLDSGVETGFLESTAQYGFNVIGKDFDPKLAKINAHITSAIQPYRNSVTGAAWGTQEDGEYQQLFGSTKYSPTELRQRLVTVKEMLKSKSATGLDTFVNPLGYYDNTFESGDYAPTDDLRSRVDAAGYDYDAMKADGLSDADIEAAL